MEALGRQPRRGPRPAPPGREAPPPAPAPPRAQVLGAWGGLLFLLLTGCASTNSTGSTPNPPARDRVLLEYRQALSALRQGHYAAAKQDLDSALLTLSGIFGPHKDARQARSMFRKEAKKTFIGEPYERVMAYFYRGILYWMDGEPDNARACFRSAQIQDADAEQKEYASDWVLLDYLDGLATAKLAGDGREAWRRAQAVSRHGQPPPYDPAANVLFFVEYGQGPTKFAAGQYREQLRFQPGHSPVSAVRLTVAGQTLRLEGYDNLSFQATTRGGRVMDHVLGNKAVFKATTDTVGNVALVSGAILATQQNQQSAVDEVGAGLLIFGLASKLISAATTPQADTRAWDTLPEWLTFAAVRVPTGTHPATLEFLGPGNAPLPHLTRSYQLNIPEYSRDLVVFVSDRTQ